MIITETTRFWSFKHKPGSDATEKDCKEFIFNAIKNNYALMQYEYGSEIEKTKMVTQNWRRITQIHVGDVIFLRGDKRIYAVGQAIKPRLPANIILEAKRIIKDKSHNQYNSREYTGIIHFSDSEVFYENLEGEENWGQRIDVDSWQYYCDEGVHAQSQDLYLEGENEYGVIKELTKESGEKIINKLLKRMGIKTEIKALVESNHNLILTGAPGTGKTYLAKQLACLLMFGKSDLSQLSIQEKEIFKEQCGFVQFHPSYDYTDFVEGLRPSRDVKGNVGFEPKDGVLKAFCAKIVTPLDQNEKMIIHYDTLYKQMLSSLKKGESFEEKKGNKVTVENIDVSKLTITIRNSNDNPVSFTKERLAEIITNYPNGKSLCNEYDNVKITGNSSVFWAVAKYFYGYYYTHIPYVFIIDEINRGEISKIFGELFFSIDPGYRGVGGDVRTQYSNMQTEPNNFDKVLGINNKENYGHFFVPENVYIIGTMNDIDRSVESMDFAFRRRFAFKEITAEESEKMLESEEAWGKDEKGISRMPVDDIQTIKDKMKVLNNLIWHNAKEGESEDAKCIEGLSSAYHIGASYFLKLVNYKRVDGSYDYDKLWDNHLEGLLLEYMRGMPSASENIKRLAKAFDYSNLSKYE